MIDDEKVKPNDEPQVAEDSQGDQDEQGDKYVGPSEPSATGDPQGPGKEGDPQGPGE